MLPFTIQKNDLLSNVFRWMQEIRRIRKDTSPERRAQIEKLNNNPEFFLKEFEF